MIRVLLPSHLRTLARIEGEIQLDLDGAATVRKVIDALEMQYPMLRGTIRDHVTLQRRPLIRFFACERDFSHTSPDMPLPNAVVEGLEPLLIVGAIAGG
ncbi:MAG TPA: MoaD/ThiS family protein [Burkholderiales bacterium]|nr:MoaD/ThiS family protein [Burkholderiales bacterium]